MAARKKPAKRKLPPRMVRAYVALTAAGKIKIASVAPDRESAEIRAYPEEDFMIVPCTIIVRR